jgi:hypothetical protein
VRSRASIVEIGVPGPRDLSWLAPTASQAGRRVGRQHSREIHYRWRPILTESMAPKNTPLSVSPDPTTRNSSNDLPETERV